MSWTITIGPVKVADLEQALMKGVAEAKVQYGTPAWDGRHLEMWQQMDVAKESVVRWIHSGALGHPAIIGHRVINAKLEGNANPGHEHKRGVAEDSLNISVWYETVREVGAEFSGPPFD